LATPNQKISEESVQTESPLNELTARFGVFNLSAEQMNELERGRISRRLGVSVEQLKKEGYFD
jgi:hypothetical protein